jgi:Tfp pilus assembly protein PilF
MRFADFLDEYCNQPEIDTFSILSNVKYDMIGYNLDGLITVLSEARDIFSGIKKNSNRVLKHIKRVKTLKEKGQEDSIEFNNILNKVEALIERVKHPLLNILVGYHYGLELYMRKQEIQEIDEIEDKWEKNDKQLERGSNYYSEVVKTIDLFSKQLNRLLSSLQREKKVDLILTDESIEQSEKYSRAGMVYKNACIANEAVRYLEMAIEAKTDMRNPVQESQDTADAKLRFLYVSLAEMYIKQYRFYEAREILERVGSQNPEVRSAQTRYANKIENLMSFCDKEIRVWDARKKKMGKLLEEAEANYGSHLESGYFYFRIHDLERAEKEYLNAITSYETSDQHPEEKKGLVEAYYGLAHTYLSMNEPERAVGVLEKALEADPSNSIVYRDLGLIAIQNNNIEPAELFFTKAIELSPETAELYKPLASLYMSLGEREKAVALYENALCVDPNNVIIQHDLAMLFKETVADTG